MPLPKITQERATQGTSGQMRQDILALSDPAKRVAETRDAAVEANATKNLGLMEAGNADQMQSLDEQAADQIMAQFRSPEHKNRMQLQEEAKEFGNRIKEMEKLAKDVEASGTGNTKAYDTYMQVADILRKKLRNLQTQAVGETQ